MNVCMYVCIYMYVLVCVRVRACMHLCVHMSVYARYEYNHRGPFFPSLFLIFHVKEALPRVPNITLRNASGKGVFLCLFLVQNNLL